MSFKLKISHIIFFLVVTVSACKKDEPSPGSGTSVPVTTVEDTTWKTAEILDDYSAYASFDYYKKWGSYNVHDPACIKVDDWYYIYSTDVMYGGTLPRVGVQIRKSQDLVHWKFVGWAFNGIPSEPKTYVTNANNGSAPSNIWAPYVVKVGSEYRMYYSVSYFGSNGSCIALATASSPEGTWAHKGIVISTTKSSSMNAIDASIVTNPTTGEQWMSYGSFWNGIYIVQLNPETGYLKNVGDQGVLVANNAQTYNAIEASELIYNAAEEKYFMFVSYNDLASNYNVRVGRSDNPNGPYTDYFGNSMTVSKNNFPILTSPYQFNNHSGWVGVGHCGVVYSGSDYYVMHQGRLASNSALMDLHVRKISWTQDGWPVFSPERFYNLEKTQATSDSISGDWEEIVLNYTSGSARNTSSTVNYQSDGTLKNIVSSSWSVSDSVLTVTKNGSTTHFIVRREWDWEHKRASFVYTGINPDGISVWGKRSR